MMRSGSLTIFSILLSVVLHGAFFASSRFVVFTGMTEVRQQSQKLFRIRVVEKEAKNVKLFESPKKRVKPLQMSGETPELDREELKKMMLSEMGDKEIYLKNKKKELTGSRPMDELMPVERPREEDAFKAEEAFLRKKIEPEKRKIKKREERQITLVTAKGPGVEEGKKKVSDYRVKRRGFKWIGKVPGIDGMIRGGSTLFGGGLFPLVNTGMNRKDVLVGDYDDVGSLLDVEVFKYEADNINKYFKIVVSAGKRGKFLVMPKEVLYLIDSSKSVTGPKLEFVKTAVSQSLRKLNKGDKFNVIAFSGDIEKFNTKSVDVSQKTIRAADGFVKRLEAVGQTDVNNALLEIIKTEPEIIPSYIVLVTDGRPTTGIIDSRKIIQQLTRHNDKRRPIFSFGGGQRVNRYLLDFISYQNRGWSRFADRTFQIKEEFLGLNDEIADPLLLDVRYRLNGIDAEEIYPKDLPDFFMGKEFIIYGKYDDEDVFSMQLLGVTGGKIKELIFKRSLADAKEGDDDIAKGWAFRKIYHLINEDTGRNGSDADIREEISKLGKRFDIITPYDIENTD